MNSGTNIGETLHDSKGITAAEEERRATKHASPFKLKLVGAAAALAGLGFLYWSMFLPIAKAMQTGAHHVYVNLRAILLLYLGIWLLVADLRDQTIAEVGPDGRPRLNHKGRIGLFVFCGGFAIMCIAVYWFLWAIGLNP
jgi:hypothetical protein